MIHISSVSNPSSKQPVPLEALEDIFQDEEIKNLCEQYRETNNVEDKQKLYLLHASGRYFFIDIDGDNHKNGNISIDYEKITSLIPHVAWFKSPSGKGIKLLIEIDRDCIPDERPSVRRYLIDSIKDFTGLDVDNCRTDVAFVSDQPITFSNRAFPIPGEFGESAIKKIKGIKGSPGNNISIGNNFEKLPEILENCPDNTDYNKWLAIVLSILKVFGFPAIALLEEKWDSQIPYSTLLIYAESCDFSILEDIWKYRIRKNASNQSREYRRRIIAGATGAGKSTFAINEMKSKFSDADTEFTEYMMYVVPSVEQALDFSEKLKRAGISYEIIVSKATFENLDETKQDSVVTESSNNVAVKIIQLAALKKNSHYKHILSDERHLYEMYIDELTLLDFVRPSLYSSDIVSSYTDIQTCSELSTYYRKNFSRSDRMYAESLLSVDDHSHFVSSILYQHVNTTVLTTEELTTTCLEALKFEKIVIKKKETDTLKETCTLHVSDSSYYVLECVKSELLQNQIDEMKFDNVFANKCEFATGNLVTIKGQHLTGKNLSIIRCLPRANISAINELFTKCFWTIENVNPAALFYKDALMQAVGRSIGFRGDTDAWVMIHSSIWSMISETEWIYKIEKWNVPIDSALMKHIDSTRIRQKSLMRDAYVEKAKFMQKEKIAIIKANLVATGNPDDKMNSQDVKQIFGAGYKLTEVAECFNLRIIKTRSCNYLEGIRQL
ncbi:MAG: hypothetical protein AB9919_12270 [Geobacteraceae bacterium]